jgi:putative transposase
MKAHQNQCPVVLMSEAFGVSVSAYYRWLQNPISKRQMRQNQIDTLIRKVFEKHKSRYGCTRITEDLKDDYGVAVKRRYVAKRMQAMGLIPKARRKFKATTDSDHQLPVAPNLLQQNFIPLANHFAAFLMWKLSLILVRNPGRISDNR